ncbi:MAG: hypothetical protein M3O82_04360 [Verrucomicrobiota bacterium]|nr:hypothetical protein [Verrucomicrobiota bacterium]
MKLGKDDLKKMIFGGMAFVLLIYCYLTMILGPLAAREKATMKSIGELTPQLADAHAQIEKTKKFESSAPAAQEKLDQIKALIPKSEPVAWFPPRMADFFKRQGIEKVATRLNNESPEKDMPGFKKLYWSIDLPKVEFIPLAIAVAGLENEEPLLQVTNLNVEAVKEDARFQHAMITVSTIVTNE